MDAETSQSVPRSPSLNNLAFPGQKLQASGPARERSPRTLPLFPPPLSVAARPAQPQPPIPHGTAPLAPGFGVHRADFLFLGKEVQSWSLHKFSLIMFADMAVVTAPQAPCRFLKGDRF